MRVEMSSAARRTSISPTGFTESRSAMRLNIPSAVFARSSFNVDPYARIPTSAVCSISAYRTKRPNALEDESPAVVRVPSEPLKLLHRLDSALTAGPDHLVHLELEPNGQALIEDPGREQSGIQPMRDVVRRRGGGEKDRPSPRIDPGQAALPELVLPAIEEDELHLAMCPERLQGPGGPGCVR